MRIVFMGKFTIPATLSLALILFFYPQRHVLTAVVALVLQQLSDKIVLPVQVQLLR
jgi:hypothetical protein